MEEKTEQMKEIVTRLLGALLCDAKKEDFEKHGGPSRVEGVICSPGSLRYPIPEIIPEIEIDEVVQCTDQKLGEILTALVKEGILQVRVEGEVIYLFYPIKR